MIEAPIAAAFAAGLVATVNPCGFAMLPAYLSYFMGLEEGDESTAADDTASNLGQALRVGATVSFGFLIVFATSGVLLNLGVRSIIGWIPYVALGIGGALIVLGLAMFSGYELSVGFLKVHGGTASRDSKSVFSFGISYALASLSCTLPVFLSVVVGSATATNFASGLVTYIAYSVGMSTLLMALTIAIAFAKQGVVRWLRSMLKYVHRVSAAFLVVAGLYIVFFWVDNLSSDPGQQRAATGFIDRLSATLTNWIGDNSSAIGLLLGGLVALVVVSRLLKRFEPPADRSTEVVR